VVVVVQQASLQLLELVVLVLEEMAVTHRLQLLVVL
jgi:hypothetical protein